MSERETAIQMILAEVRKGYTIDEAVKRLIIMNKGDDNDDEYRPT